MVFLRTNSWSHQKWNRSGFSRPDPTGKFQNLRRSTVFLQKVFVHCSMHLMNNFQKGGMDEVLKFLTPDGGLKKKNVKNFFAFFAKTTRF